MACVAVVAEPDTDPSGGGSLGVLEQLEGGDMILPLNPGLLRNVPAAPVESERP